jgi:hypothetical protein
MRYVALMSSAEQILSELISTKEAAAILSTHRSTVERQIKDNDNLDGDRSTLVIRGKRVAGKWVVLRSTVEAAAAARTERAA